MPKVNVYDVEGKVVSNIELSDAIFGIKPNKVVMHMAVVNYLATKDRVHNQLLQEVK